MVFFVSTSMDFEPGITSADTVLMNPDRSCCSTFSQKCSDEMAGFWVEKLSFNGAFGRTRRENSSFRSSKSKQSTPG